MLDQQTFNLPELVLQHLTNAVNRMDTDKDGQLSYIEFLCVLRFMSCFSQLDQITEQDIDECRPVHLQLNDIVTLTLREATEWTARIYHKREFEETVLRSTYTKGLDLVSNTDTDLESIVNYWDLDEIVEEVFNEELEAARTEDIDGEDEEIAGESPCTPTTHAQRKRKRDIVKRALNHIKNHERGSTRRKIKQTWAKLMVDKPVSPVGHGPQQQQVVA